MTLAEVVSSIDDLFVLEGYGQLSDEHLTKIADLIRDYAAAPQQATVKKWPELTGRTGKTHAERKADRIAARAAATAPAGGVTDDLVELAILRTPHNGRASTDLSFVVDCVKNAVAALTTAARAAEPEQPRLTVKLTCFPESNGKTNWTALLVRADPDWDGLIGNAGGITISRGELWNRVAYEAERARFLLGERDTEPFILDYGDDIRTPEEWKGEQERPARKRRAASPTPPTCTSKEGGEKP